MEWEQEPEKRLESITVFGVEVRAGIRSKLSPQKSADIVDMALKGKAAIVEAIEGDTDDHIHLAVVLDDDPAAIWECCGSEVNCIHSLLAQ